MAESNEWKNHKKALELNESLSTDPKYRDNDGNTFLILAVSAGEKYDVLKWLNNGCPKDAQDNKGQTAVIKAAQSNEVKIMQILCSHRCDLNIQDHQGQTALHVAVSNDCLKTVECLLSQGADVENNDVNGESPLNYAWKLGYFDVLCSLLQYGAEIETYMIDTKWGGKVHPLCTAIINERKDIAVLLIDAKLGIDVTTRYVCSSPLYLACSRPDMDEIIDKLIEAGCPVKLKNKSGQSPLDIAKLKGMQSYVAKLNTSLESTVRYEKAKQAWLVGDYEKFCNAVPMYADCTDIFRNAWGGSPHALFMATRLGHKDIIRRLSNSGEIDLNMTNSNGHTALIQAAIKGDAVIADILLSAGADYKIKVKHTMSTLRAIHFASLAGNTDFVRVIVENDGMEVCSAGTWENVAGFTPLHFAAKYSHEELVRYLLAEADNVDWSAKTSDNKSPLDIATNERIKQVFEPSTTLKRLIISRLSGLLPRKRKERSATNLGEPFNRFDQVRSSYHSVSSSYSDSSQNTIKDPYQMKEPMGLAVIINNTHFAGTKYDDRIGSNCDEEKIAPVLAKMGFQVEIHRDLTVRQLTACLLYYSKVDHTDRSSFICCIMSHGKCGHIVGVDGEKVSVSELTAFYSTQCCQKLSGKPKAFIINACQVFDNENNDYLEIPELLWVPDEEDFLISLSALPGKPSYRYEATGSPYIQQLVHEIEKYTKHQNVDLAEMTRNANKNLKLHFVNHPRLKQVSSFTSTLKRPFVLEIMLQTGNSHFENIKRWNEADDVSTLFIAQNPEPEEETKEKHKHDSSVETTSIATKGTFTQNMVPSDNVSGVQTVTGKYTLQEKKDGYQSEQNVDETKDRSTVEFCSQEQFKNMSTQTPPEGKAVKENRHRSFVSQIVDGTRDLLLRINQKGKNANSYLEEHTGSSKQHRISGLPLIGSKPSYHIELPIGLAVIINNVNFTATEYGERIGSNHDEKEVESILCELGFEVEIHRNLTASQLTDCLLYYSKVDHTDRSSFMCCIMSHWSCGHIVGVDGEKVLVSEITTFYSAQCCPKLRGKPKTFIVDACHAFDIETGRSLEIPLLRNPKEEDFLLSLSVVPVKPCDRDELSVSPYIKQLANECAKYANHRDIDVLKIMKNLDKKLTKCYKRCPRIGQVSLLTSTLKNKLVFKGTVKLDSKHTEKIKRWGELDDERHWLTTHVSGIKREGKEITTTPNVTTQPLGKATQRTKEANIVDRNKMINTSKELTQEKIKSLSPELKNMQSVEFTKVSTQEKTEMQQYARHTEIRNVDVKLIQDNQAELQLKLTQLQDAIEAQNTVVTDEHKLACICLTLSVAENANLSYGVTTSSGGCHPKCKSSLLMPLNASTSAGTQTEVNDCFSENTERCMSFPASSQKTKVAVTQNDSNEDLIKADEKSEYDKTTVASNRANFVETSTTADEEECVLRSNVRSGHPIRQRSRSITNIHDDIVTEQQPHILEPAELKLVPESSRPLNKTYSKSVKDLVKYWEDTLG